MRESEVKLSDDRQMLGVHSVCEAVATSIEYGIINYEQILEELSTKDYPIG